MRICLAFLLTAACFAQGPLTLRQAVEQAGAKYPSVRVTEEQVLAAAAGINLARTAYLPRIDTLGQVNRATRNNVFGLLLPQSVLPSMSGPVLGTNNLNSVWGTAIGGLVSWEPFDFGLRSANVAAAEASKKRAEATVGRTRFEIETLAADSFLTLLAAQQTVETAQAGVERSRVLAQVVDALVKAELRPGADASRARADLAFAQTQLIQAEQAVEVAKATLAQLLDVPLNSIALEPGPLLGLPPETPAPTNVARHPLAIEQGAAINEVKAREKILNRTYFPKFNLQGASYARGSGNVGPNIQNWAIGLTATFSVFDFASIRAKKDIEAHRQKSEEARYRQVLLELNGQVQRAQAALNGARRVAQNTPVQLDAARQALQQATARYKAGLSSVVDAAEAQRLVTQAEIDDALAKLNVWRAWLAQASAQGDLQPFLEKANP